MECRVFRPLRFLGRWHVDLFDGQMCHYPWNHALSATGIYRKAAWGAGPSGARPGLRDRRTAASPESTIGILAALCGGEEELGLCSSAPGEPHIVGVGSAAKNHRDGCFHVAVLRRRNPAANTRSRVPKKTILEVFRRALRLQVMARKISCKAVARRPGPVLGS